MADRTLVDENMAVSSDNMVSQQNLVETNKEENDGRGNQNNPKTDAPKKKTTFKITSVTKSSQPRGGNGDLTQDNDGDSIDDLDETVDSHTEDLSSEIYDTSSKATDVDNLDPLLTPEEVTKEKPGRFKVVKVESKEPFKRGRWLCYDFLDTPDNRQEEIHVNSGSSSAANSLHYVHGVDDPSKNPLSAGATGTVSSQRQQDTGLNRTPVDMFQPIQPAPVSQPVLNQVPITTGLLNNSMANAGFLNQMVQSVSNVPYSNHIAQSLPNAHPIASHVGQQGPVSYTVNTALPGHSLGHLITVSKGMHGVGSVPNLVEIHGQGIVSQCLPGTIPNPSVQHQQSQPHHQPPQPTPVGMSNTANVHSHQTPAPILAAQILNAVPLGEYSNSTATISGQVAMGQHQQQTQSTLGYNLSTTTTVNNAPGVVPLQNHLGALGSQDIANIEGNVMLEQNVNVMPSSSTADLSTILPRVPEIGERVEENIPVSSLAPLETAIGGITNPTQDEEITEEAGSSTVAIDNKIEQAMDLVKSHLMYAVREEVEVLKEQIKELMDRLSQLEYENNFLRREATQETLSKLAAAQSQPQPPPSS